MAEYKGFMSPPSVIDDRVIERAMWLATTDEHKAFTVKDLAQKMVRSGKFASDPFAVARMKTHLKHGIATPDDYRKLVRVEKEPRF